MENKKICVFCTNPGVKEREIIRNELAWAFPTNIPIVPGHVLICPIRCVDDFNDLTQEEVLAIFDLQKKLKKAFKKVFGAEGFNYAWNEAEVGGQAVPHFHLHMLPRKEGDTGITEYDPRKFLYRPGSRETSPDEELDAVVKEIKKHLE
ncbi:HIT domain-containing protein [Candidatus Nomurabacteria bacterium]|nr:HIT domain-containing protein [Candidatus Nomurabacteria bacterium]